MPRFAGGASSPQPCPRAAAQPSSSCSSRLALGHAGRDGHGSGYEGRRRASHRRRRRCGRSSGRSGSTSSPTEQLPRIRGHGSTRGSTSSARSYPDARSPRQARVTVPPLRREERTRSPRGAQAARPSASGQTWVTLPVGSGTAPRFRPADAARRAAAVAERRLSGDRPKQLRADGERRAPHFHGNGLLWTGFAPNRVHRPTRRRRLVLPEAAVVDDVPPPAAVLPGRAVRRERPHRPAGRQTKKRSRREHITRNHPGPPPSGSRAPVAGG